MIQQQGKEAAGKEPMYLIRESELQEHSHLARECGRNDMSVFRGNPDYESDLSDLEVQIHTHPAGAGDAGQVLKEWIESELKHEQSTSTIGWDDFEKGDHIGREEALQMVLDHINERRQQQQEGEGK